MLPLHVPDGMWALSIRMNGKEKYSCTYCQFANEKHALFPIQSVRYIEENMLTITSIRFAVAS
jgi:hypothetical protein